MPRPLRSCSSGSRRSSRKPRPMPRLSTGVQRDDEQRDDRERRHRGRPRWSPPGAAGPAAPAPRSPTPVSSDRATLTRPTTAGAASRHAEAGAHLGLGEDAPHRAGQVLAELPDEEDPGWPGRRAGGCRGRRAAGASRASVSTGAANPRASASASVPQRARAAGRRRPAAQLLPEREQHRRQDEDGQDDPDARQGAPATAPGARSVGPRRSSPPTPGQPRQPVCRVRVRRDASPPGASAPSTRRRDRRPAASPALSACASTPRRSAGPSSARTGGRPERHRRDEQPSGPQRPGRLTEQVTDVAGLRVARMQPGEHVDRPGVDVEVLPRRDLDRGEPDRPRPGGERRARAGLVDDQRGAPAVVASPAARRRARRAPPSRSPGRRAAAGRAGGRRRGPRAHRRSHRGCPSG